MNPYTNIYGKFFTGDKRNESIPLQKEAEHAGVLPDIKTVACRMCGQTEGMKAWHCEDYDDPVGDATCLCWRCHMIWHSRFRNPNAVFRYVYEVTVLKNKYPPVIRHNFDILKKDHGI